jgi:hypothetical protein
MEDETLRHALNVPHQMALPLQKIRIHEVENIIQHKTFPSKAPGYDLITGKILQELPKKGLRAITQIYNAVPRIEYFPCHWKVGQVIMIAKPRKTPADVTSYRPISLLPLLSKVLKKLILRRLIPIIADNKLIPSHQFGFRPKHGTIEQVHRVVHKINDDLENKRVCSAAFIDISQAFDKVWHTGLLYKIKLAFPHPVYALIKSYLTYRTFQVRYQAEYTTLHDIHSGVPQGSILGPLLYSIFTAILASHPNPITAFAHLQHHLNLFEQWLKRWRIQANGTKSTHVTFTLKREDCPAVLLNGNRIPQDKTVKYLDIHLDRRLTWKTHILTKRK